MGVLVVIVTWESKTNSSSSLTELQTGTELGNYPSGGRGEGGLENDGLFPLIETFCFTAPLLEYSNVAQENDHSLSP